MLKNILPHVFTFLIVIFVLTLIINLLKKRLKKLPNDFPYQKQDTLLTPAERSFFGVLEQVLSEKARIFSKVRVGDVLKVSPILDKSRRTTALNRINLKHVDFVLCNTDDLSILGAIELDDQSHMSSRRKDRDDFLDKSFAAAQVPLLRVPAKIAYATEEVKELLVESFGLSFYDEDTKQSFERPEKPICSKCGEDMVKRKATKGKHAGKLFWACSAFPKCREIVPA
jgi:hypothetical protein